jgi:hypothetical protein
MVPKVRQVIYQMAQFLTARKVALLKLLRLALAINQLSQLNGFSENSPPVDPTSTMARLLTDPSIYQQFIFEMIALIQVSI